MVARSEQWQIHFFKCSKMTRGRPGFCAGLGLKRIRKLRGRFLLISSDMEFGHGPFYSLTRTSNLLWIPSSHPPSLYSQGLILKVSSAFDSPLCNWFSAPFWKGDFIFSKLLKGCLTRYGFPESSFTFNKKYFWNSAVLVICLFEREKCAEIPIWFNFDCGWHFEIS